MRKQLTFWAALFLLVMSGAALGSFAASIYCTAGLQSLTLDTEADVASSADSDATACPLATLAEFVATPMVITPAIVFGVVRAGYEAPLYLFPRYQFESEPPTKPPSA